MPGNGKKSKLYLAEGFVLSNTSCLALPWDLGVGIYGRKV
jgi:hypothetical protein